MKLCCQSAFLELTKPLVRSPVLHTLVVQPLRRQWERDQKFVVSCHIVSLRHAWASCIRPCFVFVFEKTVYKNQQPQTGWMRVARRVINTTEGFVCSSERLHIRHWVLQGSVAVKRHHDHSNSYKGQQLIGVGLQFRGLVHCHHCGKHSSKQADMALEKKSLHLDLQTAGDWVPYWVQLKHRRPQNLPTQ